MAPRHDCSVFISYRRMDTGGYAGRLADALAPRFGAGMPAAADLPTDLHRLARQQALELSDSRWAHDLDRLVEAIQRCASLAAPPQARSLRRPALFAIAALLFSGALGGTLYSRSRRMPELTGRVRLSSDGRTLTGELRVPDRDPAQARFAPDTLIRR